MDDREKLASLMEEISGKFNLDLKTEEVKELHAVIDEELDNCIKKLRNAVYGRDVRIFITEYEELMLKKSDLVTWEFLKEEDERNCRQGMKLLNGEAMDTKIKLLNLRYGKYRKAWEGTSDDRKVFCNIYDMLVEACECMKSVRNNLIHVAFNRQFKEEEETLKEILQRFTEKKEVGHEGHPECDTGSSGTRMRT